MLAVTNRLEGVALGLIRAEGVRASPTPPALERALGRVLAERRRPLMPGDDAIRRAARDMLRNGRYKPTGRGKPASEYLLRAAAEGRFPRINALVDACNCASLAHVLPASLWDLDRAATDRFLFRLGRPGEAYVFNGAGQTIALEDLVVGCRLAASAADGGDVGTPIVNPVKDSMPTKTHDGTTRVAGCVYAPADALDRLHAATDRFADALASCGDGVSVASALASPGETARL